MKKFIIRVVCVLFPVCLRGSDGRSVKDYEYGRNRHDGA